MRFIEDGPDIPDDLIEGVAARGVVFLCGAGVSRRVDLPLFKGLVEDICSRLGGMEDAAEKRAFKNGAYDRVLHALEKRTRAPGSDRSIVREKVAEILQPPDKPLDDHLAILRLSRNIDERPRLITTNFDTLFERAWWKKCGEAIPSLAGASLAAPGKPRDHGVLHLHGRIADSDLRLEETDLVLTSADFGDAYLRSGWASRHIDERLRLHTLVLVGYQAEDSAMRLLLDSLDADRDRFPDLKPVYAFDREARDNGPLWEAKGARPILYGSEDEGDHDRLYATLREWAEYNDDPAAFARSRLEAIFSKEANGASEFEKEQAVFLLPRHGGEDLLAELNPPFSWAGVFQNAKLISMGHR